MKLRKCNCGNEYQQYSTLQTKCVPCLIEKGNRLQRQQERRTAIERRKDTRERRERLKTRSDWLREAQIAFNAYIRERDRGKACISCSKNIIRDPVRGGMWDCGHYRSIGSCPELRFHPFNSARQCVRCNRDLSGNSVEYRTRLLDRIGQKNLDWLEGPHQAQHWSVEDIKEIKKHYREQLRLLIKAR